MTLEHAFVHLVAHDTSGNLMVASGCLIAALLASYVHSTFF